LECQETQCQFLEIHLLSLNLIKTVITTLFNTQNPLISGYISKQNLELLKGTVPFQSIKRRWKIIVLQITRILDHSGWVQKSCYGMLFSLAT
jgi:hypothetical protein